MIGKDYFKDKLFSPISNKIFIPLFVFEEYLSIYLSIYLSSELAT